jgi:hypothetical protein
MNKWRAILILLISSCLFADMADAAASISGSTTVAVDAVTGIVTATCETDLSLQARIYYLGAVSCDIYDGAGNWENGGYQQGAPHAASVRVIVTFVGVPGTAYRAEGSHSASVTLQDEEPDPLPPHTLGLFYVDYYDFGYFSQNPVWGFYDGQYIEDPYPFYTWQSVGPRTVTRYPNLIAGMTRDDKVFPINTNLLVIHAQGDFLPGCDTAFAKVIGSSYSKSNFFISLSSTTFYQYPLAARGASADS